MKNLFTVPFIFFILFACNCIAQEVPIFQWAKNLGGSSTEGATTIKTDASGNVYVGGYFNSSTADFDPGTGTVNLSSAGSDDAFICKLTSAGELVWARSFGSNSADYVTDLEIDDAGNVYATGYFANTVDFNPGTGTFNLTSAGSYDAFIVKLTTDGDFIWAGNVGGSSSDYGNQIALDNAGNVFITGHFFSSSADFNPGAGIVNFSSTGGTDVFVLKLDNNGSYQWARQFGGVGSDEGHTIAIDGLDNVVITGQFYDYSAPFDFDPGPATVTLTQVGSTISEWDIFICKLNNSTGDIAWAKSISAPRWDETEAMTVDNQNNILLTGHFSGTADFDPDGSVFQLTASGNTDPFIVKLNSSGNFLWAKSFAGSSSSVNQYGDYIVTDASRNVYTCGSLYSALDADPGPSVFNLSSSGQRDAYYSKLDENGNFIWAYRIGSNGFDRGHSITLDPFGSVYMAGYFSTTADFNPGTGTFNLTSNGSSDAFIQKITFGTPANPTITSFSPTAGAIGTPVTITGTNFSTTPANNIVQFNGTNTPVTASTTTSITTSVPAGATTGKITVTTAGNTATSATDFTVTSALPAITSFTPASGPIGTSVNIIGTNFSTTLSNNIVYFGATKATVTAATATQLNVIVPIGATYKSISVSVGGLIAYSSKPFIVTFPGATLTECSFAPRQDLTAGSFPLSVESGDFDGDGKADLAVANYESNALSVFHNTSTGAGTISFAPKIDLPSGPGANHIAIDDLDGDGKLDLAVVNHGGGDVSIFHNISSAAGSINFAARINFTTGSTPRSVAIDDLDKDGKPDLVIANYGEGVNTISVLRNTSTGPGSISFAPKIDFTAGTRPAAVAIEDLDGDGKPDIAVVSQNSATLSIFLNTSSGAGNISLAPKTDFSTNPNPIKVSIGDLDGDGKPDIAIAGSLGSNVNVFRNTTSSTGNVSFAARIELSAGLLPWSVSIGDINGDGKPDLSAPNVSSGFVTVFQNGSTGIGNLDFATNFNFTTRENSQTCSITDFDGDGKPDLAATSFYGIHVLRNIIAPPPTITGFTPTSGTTGTTVTITGTNFDPTPSNNIVQFNGIGTTVTASTTTTITTTVPSGVTTGKISVTVGCSSAVSTGNFTTNTTTNQPPVISSATAAVPIEGIVTIDLEPLISDPDDNLDPTSLYLETSVSEQGASASLGDESFLLTLNYGDVPFFGTDQVIIGVCDLAGECAEQTLTIEVGGDVFVFNALSPNGDGKNETFIIQYIDILPETQSNNVTILNRWGDVVFEIRNYNNTDRVFKGLGKNGQELPSGTYFYKIEFTGGRKTQTGYLSLKR